jgi:uncharacterized protein YecE (DUF72 family)
MPPKQDDSSPGSLGKLRFPPNLLVGTSSWSSADWCGTFYPETIDAGEMIRVYSSKLPTVEIDATWYSIPSLKMVESWKSRTPDGFVFSAKVPKVISHDKYLEDCQSELNEFLSVMSRLEEKLGPLIFQFPYVAKGKDAREYETGADFMRRLNKFIGLLPPEFKWGIEIRNAKWVAPPLLDILRSRSISLVFVDYYTMDPLYKLAGIEGIYTAPFVYVRFLGNHKSMDAAVKKARDEGKRKRDWESLILDRTEQMKLWITPLKDLTAKRIPVYVYFNNHYAGYAPGSVELFEKLFNQEFQLS